MAEMRFLLDHVAVKNQKVLELGKKLLNGRYRYAIWSSVLLLPIAAVALLLYLKAETPDNAAWRARRAPLPLMSAGQDRHIDPLPSSYLSDDRLAATVHSVRDHLKEASPSIEPTGFKREDYLRLIQGVVTYFRQFQDARGRIIDPYLHREIQYATPAFALAAATLIASGTDRSLLESASKAIDSALYQLASGVVTDRHGDFFIMPTMMAYRQLKSVVDLKTKARWDRYLRIIRPEVSYSDLIGPGQSDVMNWNSNAIAGEFLRHKEGFTDLTFVDRYLDAQVPRFNPEGLYRDPGFPLVYDASARFNFLLLIQEGYEGQHRRDLEVLLERGAWASLLMQSPNGDAPTGGRSAEHVWTDALQCAAFEMWAHRIEQTGDWTGAKAFKRAAHLAARLMSRWVRPSGEFWIVKNKFDPALRRGFETYSSHSQYNLLAAAYLSMAWLNSDETIAEGVSPADIGGFVIEIPDFHKIFANSGGHYIEIDTAADLHYNSTGLLREHKARHDPHLGLGDNAPGGEDPLALGIGWRADGKDYALAAISNERVHSTLTGIEIKPNEARFAVSYKLDDVGIGHLREDYSLTPDAVTVSDSLDGPVDSWRVTLPVFVSDGQALGQAVFSGNIATLRSQGTKQIFEIISPPGAVIQKTGHVVAIRTGDYELAEAHGSGNVVSYRLSAPVIDAEVK